MKANWRLILGIVLVFVLPFSAEAQLKLRVITQEFPPLQMEVDGQLAGFTVETIQEVIKEVQKRLDVTVEQFEFLPWKRALKVASIEKNVVFFSLSRTDQRESLFHWVGTIAPYELHLFRSVDRPDIQATSLKDLKGKGYRIGLQGGSNLQEFLVQKGFGENSDNTILHEVTRNAQTIRLVQRGRLDLMAQVAVSFPIRVKQEGLPIEDFRPVLKLDELSKQLWVVLSKPTAPELVRLFIQGLAQVKSDGRYDEIVTKYLDTTMAATE